MTYLGHGPKDFRPSSASFLVSQAMTHSSRVQKSKDAHPMVARKQEDKRALGLAPKEKNTPNILLILTTLHQRKIPASPKASTLKAMRPFLKKPQREDSRLHLIYQFKC